VKAVALAAHAKMTFGLRLYRAPIQKSVLLVAGGLLIPASLFHRIDPLIAFVAFEALLLALFYKELRR
jgi:hypothetical protein